MLSGSIGCRWDGVLVHQRIGAVAAADRFNRVLGRSCLNCIWSCFSLFLSFSDDGIPNSSTEFHGRQSVIEELGRGTSACNYDDVRSARQSVLQADHKAAVSFLELVSLGEGCFQELGREAVETFGDKLANRGISDVLLRVRDGLLRPAQVNKVNLGNFLHVFSASSILLDQAKVDDEVTALANVVILQPSGIRAPLTESILHHGVILLESKHESLCHVNKLADNFLCIPVNVVVDPHAFSIATQQIVHGVTVDHVHRNS